VSNPKSTATVSSSVGVVRDYLDNANLPTSKSQSRLAKLRVRWGSSLLHKLLWEFGIGLPLRIQVVLREPELRFGYRLPRPPEGHDTGTLYPPNKFLLACNSDIQQLRAEFPWCGVLELTVAGSAYRMGARWGLRNASSEKSDIDCRLLP